MELRWKNEAFDLDREEAKHFDLSFTDQSKEASKEVKWWVKYFREEGGSGFSFKSKEEGLSEGILKEEGIESSLDWDEGVDAVSPEDRSRGSLWSKIGESIMALTQSNSKNLIYISDRDGSDWASIIDLPKLFLSIRRGNPQVHLFAFNSSVTYFSLQMNTKLN